MEEIKKFIVTELFQNYKAEVPLHQRVKSLIDAFKDNKPILNILHDYAINNLKPLDGDVLDTLKREWFKVWIKNSITQDEIPIIKYYFDSYTPREQRILMEKIELESQTSLDKDSTQDLQLKKMSPLNLAIYHYKKGEIEPLKDYIDSLKSLSKTELNKIIETIYEHTNNEFHLNIKNGALPIIVSLYNKTSAEHKIWIEKNINSIDVLMHPKEDIEQYNNILNHYYSARCARYGGTKEKTVETIKNEFILSHLVWINFNMHFGMSCTRFYNSIRDLESSDIITVLENADIYLKKYNPSNKENNKKFGIKGTGINILLNELKANIKEYKYSDFTEKAMRIINLYEIYKEEKILRKELPNKLDVNKPIKPKLKL